MDLVQLITDPGGSAIPSGTRLQRNEKVTRIRQVEQRGGNDARVVLHTSGQALITGPMDSLISIQNGLKVNVSPPTST